MKNIVSKILKYVINEEYRFMIQASQGKFDMMPDQEYIEKKFKIKVGYELNLNCPKTFNEKIQWLKLNDHNPIYSILVDKYEAKSYVASILGNEYIIPTFGVWDNFEEINFNQLPYQFVLKTTHDSGGVVICTDKKKFNYKKVRKKLMASIKHNYYLDNREWPYKNVKPRIIAEKFIGSKSSEIQDYKFFCFSGIPKIILVCTNRFSEKGLCETFYDINWNKLDLRRPLHPTDHNLKKPPNLKTMLSLAERLAKEFAFVRVDFYDTGDKVFFGEMTFYPAGGFEGFQPTSWDKKMGEWIRLP